jgi:acetylornithine deacetylase/succinyl-diaminopimelate desuccinylase-like protein
MTINRIVCAICGAMALAMASSSVMVTAQSRREPDWRQLEPETLQHFQALLRIDTTNPPGNETAAVDYLAKIEGGGIPSRDLRARARRANLVARLKGNGRKRPLLLMGHTDTVTVEPAKWTFPPFSATRDGGYITGAVHSTIVRTSSRAS